MQFKSTLLTLSSLVFLVAARGPGPLRARQHAQHGVGLTCTHNQTLQCCDLHPVTDANSLKALQKASVSSAGLTGSVGQNCMATTTDTNNDFDNICREGYKVACCPAAAVQPSKEITVNCTEIGD